MGHTERDSFTECVTLVEHTESDACTERCCVVTFAELMCFWYDIIHRTYSITRSIIHRTYSIICSIIHTESDAFTERCCAVSFAEREEHILSHEIARFYGLCATHTNQIIHRTYSITCSIIHRTYSITCSIIHTTSFCAFQSTALL